MMTKFIITGISFLIGVASSLAANNIESIIASVDQIVESHTDGKGSLIIGIVTNSGAVIKPYGFIDEKINKLPNENSIYEIGSLTKTLTSITALSMLRDNNIPLTNPITLRAGLARNTKNPLLDSISYLDLLTHHSGLPRLPLNIGFVIKDPEDPYSEYGALALGDFLKTATPDKEKPYEYSNLGYGMLGNIIEEVDRKGYEKSVIWRLLDKLDMKSTKISLLPQDSMKVVPGHFKDGSLAKPWNFKILAGCGAFRSTMKDMFVYLQANLGLINNPLNELIDLSHTRIKDIDGNKLGIAYAWHISKINSDDLIWHNGATGGYASFMGFVKSKKLGVVILTNYSNIDADAIGIDIMQLLLKDN